MTILEQFSDITKNGMALNRVNKIYKYVSILYVAICLPYALISLFAGFTSGPAYFAVMLLEFLFKAGLIVCGVMSCYTRQKYLVFIAFACQLLSAIINPIQGTFIDLFFLEGVTGISFNRLLFGAVTVACGFTLYADAKYSYLEDQEGFPHFNERQLQQEYEIQQSRIKDKYQINYERIVKSSADEMNDISNSKDTFTPREYSASSYDDNDYMDSI